MLKLTPTNTYPVKVEIDAQGLKGNFTAQFNRMDDTELAAMIDGLRELVAREATMVEITDYRREQLDRSLDSVDDILADGKPMDPQEAKRWVLSSPAAAAGAFDAFIASCTGSKEKNSKPSHAR